MTPAVNTNILADFMDHLFPLLMKPVAHARLMRQAREHYDAHRPESGLSFVDYVAEQAEGIRSWAPATVKQANRRATRLTDEVLDAIEGTKFETIGWMNKLTYCPAEHQLAKLREWLGGGDKPDPPTPGNVIPFPGRPVVVESPLPGPWWTASEDSDARFCIPGLIELRCGDSSDILQTLEQESFDAIITDQPYGVGYEDAAGVGIAGDENPDDIARWSAPAMNRVLKPNSFAVLHGVSLGGGHDVDIVWRQHLRSAELPMVARAIWVKNVPRQGGPHLMHKHEEVWVCAKGSPHPIDWVDHDENLTGRGVGQCIGRDVDVWFHDCAPKSEHPTPKPVDLHKREMLNFTPAKGSVVLDPFMGTGATALAALATGRQYVGIEIDERWFKIAVERVKDWLRAEGRLAADVEAMAA